MSIINVDIPRIFFLYVIIYESLICICKVWLEWIQCKLNDFFGFQQDILHPKFSCPEVFLKGMYTYSTGQKLRNGHKKFSFSSINLEVEDESFWNSQDIQMKPLFISSNQRKIHKHVYNEKYLSLNEINRFLPRPKVKERCKN